MCGFRMSHAWRDASFFDAMLFERCFTDLSFELISSPVRLEVKQVVRMRRDLLNDVVNL